MNRFWRAAQAGLFLLDPETAHEASLLALEAGIDPRACKPDDPRLAQTLFGLSFPNPIGVAAGYDKDARVYNALFSMGFGFAEAGTVTPRPRPGNPRPRSFRLIRERAVINRMGFNNAGHGPAMQPSRLARQARQGRARHQFGANRGSADPIADYARGRASAPGAFASSISPSTSPRPTRRALRDLQAPDRLDSAASLCDDASGAALPRPVPVLVKLAPDLADRRYRAGHGLPHSRIKWMVLILHDNTTLIARRCRGQARMAARPAGLQACRSLAPLHAL